MPVTGKNRETRRLEYIPEFSKSREHFDIGVVFRYKPKNFQGNIPVLVMPVKDTRSDVALLNCAKDCALYRFCISNDNYDDNGARFVPACGPVHRKDGNSVHFVEV